MASPAPTPGRVIRTLVLLVVKARYHKLLRRFWRKQPGLLHIFNICIKTKPDENLTEAHAMRFIASHTSIPVPKVYYAFTYKGDSYIVMRHIKGQMAGHGWLSRTEESKMRILDQLRRMITELRSVPPPEGQGVSSIDGGPFYDFRLPSRLYWGPYGTVREFHEALVDGMNLDADYTLAADLSELFEFYQQSGNELVLTHGDLSSLNILVRGDTVVGIVDWETAGWFLVYWEYTCAKYVNPQNPFWADPVDQFLVPMPDELKMETIRRKYFGDF
ncbi:uncharacterized protein VDAG_09518 [Verticillium dahliae VdLs.17]|uniref:Aminoglycoside phosphotransferase domain-containing protein n=2 Tax=Verticillium dahliae TaxID=27337 RepID=G2XH86_VERDV|nr:uncharacterized protein VDAG_09518 [Verticillium dahliae VdLs.17]EGY19184.1 hypothetical protein VDAG_09518 [Verticillium dahliae VdLs.17]KAH6688745.1 kinase-like domain-containing protein [Verticillium dahliae]